MADVEIQIRVLVVDEPRQIQSQWRLLDPVAKLREFPQPFTDQFSQVLEGEVGCVGGIADRQSADVHMPARRLSEPERRVHAGHAGHSVRVGPCVRSGAGSAGSHCRRSVRRGVTRVIRVRPVREPTSSRPSSRCPRSPDPLRAAARGRPRAQQCPVHRWPAGIPRDRRVRAAVSAVRHADRRPRIPRTAGRWREEPPRLCTVSSDVPRQPCGEVGHQAAVGVDPLLDVGEVAVLDDAVKPLRAAHQ